MTVEQIAIRQEIRQMLNEAGINRNTLKEMTKDVLEEEIKKACAQAMHEKDIKTMVEKAMKNDFDRIVRSAISESVRNRVDSVFNRMAISIDIRDEKGNSSITR